MSKLMSGFLVFFLAVLVTPLAVSDVNAEDRSLGEWTLVALKTTRDSVPPMSIRRDRIEVASFCGACSNSDHDACGGQKQGWSCCSAGCTGGKMKCWKVTDCNKISGLDDGLDPSILLAQSDYCNAWYSNIQAELSSYNAQCSGSLEGAQYDYCARWADRINADIASYNSQCG